MTAQFAERLHYQGEDVAMCTNPLSDYFAMSGLSSPFGYDCTALARGYIGSWEIVDDRLYLIGLGGLFEDSPQMSLTTIFPGFPDRVFAHWYSGTIRIPQGKLLQYVHAGYGSTYERDLLLDVERGVVVATRVRQNGVAEAEGAPEGYEAGAMAVFLRAGKDEGEST